MTTTLPDYHYTGHSKATAEKDDETINSRDLEKENTVGGLNVQEWQTNSNARK